MTVKRLLFFIIAVPVLLFILQNFQITELRFLAWRIAMPHALLLILVLGAGILLGSILHAIVAGGEKKETVASRTAERP